jgi:quinol monooxygenase YgiN
MRDGEEIRLVIEFAVSDMPRFKEMAGAMVELSRAEPGTRVYDWYLDESTGKGCLYEAYESFDAIVAHSRGPVFTEVAPKFAGVFTVEKVDVFGDAAQMAERGDVLDAPTSWWGPAIAALAG